MKLFGEKWSAVFAMVCGVALWGLLFANAGRSDREPFGLTPIVVALTLNGFIGCVLGWMMWVVVRTFNRMFSMKKKQKEGDVLSE